MNFAPQDITVLRENKFGYEPDAEEIYEYGEHLGLTFPEDQKFIPILYQGLKASLPDHWEAVQIQGYGDMVFYRNKSTNLIQEDHPVDAIYRQKIHKIKNMTANLAFDVIAEETESWLRQSSEVIRNSKHSGENIHKSGDQVFIENIEEEQSFYDHSATSNDEAENSKRDSKKMVHSARTYRKKNEKLKRKIKIPMQVQKQITFQQKVQVLKEKLNSYWPKQSITLEKIRNKEISCLKSEEEMKNLQKIQKSLQQIQDKKRELQKIKLQKRRKQQRIIFLRKSMGLQ